LDVETFKLEDRKKLNESIGKGKKTQRYNIDNWKKNT